MKDDCPMKIRFSLSSDCQYLIISEINEEHNHIVTKENFLRMPRQRKLKQEDVEEVQKLMNLQCNKKLVQQYVSQKTGKCVILKDLSNIKTAKTALKDNDLKVVVEKLQSDNANVDVLVDENRQLMGIFYQDANMQKYFNLYPEVLLCDSTYKLNNLRMPLFILIVIDGNGHCEIVATFLAANETESLLTEMLQSFKNYNPAWNMTKTILTDKDLTERKVFTKEFPDAKLLLCLFHTLKTFRTNITVEKMNINAAQRDTSLKILQNLAYSRTVYEYESNYKKLLDLNLPKVNEYFQKNWHPIRDEWVEGFKKSCVTFNTSTTNHLENINQKIKSVCIRFSKLSDFYTNLLVTIAVQRSEKDQIIHNMFLKRNIHKFPQGSDHDKFSKCLTPYAFKFIEKRLSKSVSDTNNNNIEVCENKCTCLFHIDMKLPCEHIFEYRRKNNMPLFEETIIPMRFKKTFYIQKHFLENQNEFTSTIQEQALVRKVETKIRIKTQTEKYKEAIRIFSKLASLLSEKGTRQFLELMEKVSKIINLIESDKEWDVVEHENPVEDYIQEENEEFETEKQPSGYTIENEKLERDKMKDEEFEYQSNNDPKENEKNYKLKIDNQIKSHIMGNQENEQIEMKHQVNNDRHEGNKKEYQPNNELMEHEQNDCVNEGPINDEECLDVRDNNVEIIYVDQEGDYQNDKAFIDVLDNNVNIIYVDQEEDHHNLLEEENIYLEQIMLNTPMKQNKGRPKGRELTVVGVKRKRHK